MSNVIDIDERAGSFEPVVVRFRGREYALGAKAMELIGATAVYTENPKEDGENEIEYSLRLAPKMARVLNADLAGVLAAEDLTGAEMLAFLPVLTEVVSRVGALKFR